MYKKHILVCEKGWRKMRELSIELAGKNITSTVLIKGLVDKQVKEMITRYKEINNFFVPAKIFTPFLFIYILVNLAILPKRGLTIFLSKEKSYHRLTIFKKLFPWLELIKVYD